jgi:Tetracyclin repressor-like, C-terminal domain
MDSGSGRALALAAIAEPVLPFSPDPSLLAQPEALVARAVARGEWDAQRHPPQLVLSLITGAVMHRLYLERLPVTEEWSSALVAVVLGGVGR